MAIKEINFYGKYRGRGRIYIKTIWSPTTFSICAKFPHVFALLMLVFMMCIVKVALIDRNRTNLASFFSQIINNAVIFGKFMAELFAYRRP